MVFKVIVHEDKDGLWAEVPSIKGCFSQGETMEKLYILLVSQSHKYQNNIE